MTQVVLPTIQATDDAAVDCLIVGGGFTGLSAALDLTRQGRSVLVLEQDTSLGGLAGGFDIGGFELEKFYHHWFVSDREVTDLVAELGRGDCVVTHEARTGMYFSNNFFRLSTPMDLLRFSALPFLERIRLGIGVLRARQVRDWMQLENRSSREWLLELFGEKVFKVVWEPLLVGKFGVFADTISAVWFWKKLVLRGGSRANSGKEMLAYYRGGFAALARHMGEEILRRGGRIETGVSARRVLAENGRAVAVETSKGVYKANTVLLTTALPDAANLLQDAAPETYLQALRRVQYLANICLVLQLDRSLSSTYWLNVNDPGFPFVGVIEHTNFEPPEYYGNSHIVYLSRYLPATDAFYTMPDDELLEFALPHLKRMFPALEKSWIKQHYVWRADYAQPIVEKHYSKIVPGMQTPLDNVLISTMAQVYPEDRGTNYAIREGKKVAAHIVHSLSAGKPQA